MPSVVSRSLRWKAIRGLGVSLGISVVSNLIDFTWGENKNKGVRSNEFAASTMVDFAQAGLIGVGSALAVGAVIAGVGLSAPLWFAALVTAGVGLAAGAIIDSLVDTDKLKEKVSNGLSAWGGVFQNSLTIAKVSAERVRNVKDAVFETIDNVGDSIKTIGKNLSEAAQDVKDKIGGLLGGIFGTGS
jgi:hypothetical protein